MSGGHFDYKQFHIGQIADQIQQELDKQGKLKPKEELFNRAEFYNQYPSEKYYEVHPEQIQQKMQEAIKLLKQAKVYTQRIDYYLSGDDGPETFIQRLTEDLAKP